ncbi:hypothetical protein ASG49_15610 [Marmoricola sp. Leaf446]|uniref:PP2C family protein-serine/threonine phosphatase n=1 Tax=Marmoricola sp. Leaf446 TaxID=1736379 RepID=UPI000700AD7A|nr:SpoIIE family protein phosphatase [Marmoricola sp. Leaf446]KQT89222.1 hypothetical protein ASG49_15610 [Marmoricola sp. Leaf446]
MDTSAEAERLRALRDLAVLDAPPEDRFDRVVRLAQHVFDVPMVAVNLVDEDRVVPHAQVGLGSGDIPRSVAFCSTTVQGEGQLLVADAQVDQRFASNPLVQQDPHIRFYAGQPLRAAGQNVGTLCLLDSRPRDLTAEQSRMLRDLAQWVENELTLSQETVQAREVQRRLLPSRAPDVPGLDLAGRCVPARDVGGDFFDWQRVEGGLQVVVADVMGKGMTAAILAAGVRAVLRAGSLFHDLATSLERTATSMADDLDGAASFVTLFAGRLDPGSGDLEYVDAGHGLAVVLSPTGGARRLVSVGMPVGADPGESWPARTERLAPGEALLVVSDGVLDAFETAEEAVAEAERLARRGLRADQLVEAVLERTSHRLSPDDVTVVVVRREQD